jgi:predicted DCC family thiol-disulfide oxidoreductase YuxK
MSSEGSIVAKKPVVVFDGFCNFCSGAVSFLKKKDKKGLFEFVALHDLSKHREYTEFSFPINPNESLVVFDTERNSMYYSSAILYVLKTIGGFWIVAYHLVRIVPKPIRDYLYKGFAKRRYLLFGKTRYCSIPDK